MQVLSFFRKYSTSLCEIMPGTASGEDDTIAVLQKKAI